MQDRHLDSNRRRHGISKEELEEIALESTRTIEMDEL